jgi:uncharacterized protein (DUF433 family)
VRSTSRSVQIFQNLDLLKILRLVGTDTAALPCTMRLTPGLTRASPRSLAASGAWWQKALMMDWSQCSEVERKPGKLSGAWVFKGTRVPVRALFENVQGGARVEDFLEWFPGVTRDQVDAVLKLTEESLDVVAA